METEVYISILHYKRRLPAFFFLIHRRRCLRESTDLNYNAPYSLMPYNVINHTSLIAEGNPWTSLFRV